MLVNYSVRDLHGQIQNLQAEYITLDEIEYLDERYVKTRYQNIKVMLNSFYGSVIPRRCCVCQKPFGSFDLHHCLVDKNLAAGWSFERGVFDKRTVRRLLIDTELNLSPIHHTPCHMDNPPTKQSAWTRQCEIYGEKLVMAWYESLPFKNGPPQYFS